MTNRREFIRAMGIGAAGSIAGYPFPGMAKAVVQSQSSSQVSLVSGTDRRKMAHDALLPFTDVIKSGIQGKQIILKPNVVEPFCPFGVTNIDTLRGVLDFLTGLTDQKIIIGEASATPSLPGGRLPVNNTLSNFSHYGYYALNEKYHVEFVDFNARSSTTVNWITDFNSPRGNVVVPMNIADPYLDTNNFFFSLANLKTHSMTVCTLSIKNFCMSSPLNFLVKIPESLTSDYVAKWLYSEKNKMHLGSYKGLNYNIVRVARNIQPGFALLDGVTGMEGDGPTIYGKLVEQGVMIAGPDMVSVDRIGIELMGLDYNTIKHVQYCALAGVGQGDIGKIVVLGPNIDNFRTTYKLPSTFQQTTTPITWIKYEPTTIAEFSSPTAVNSGPSLKDFPITVANVPNPFNASTEIHVTLSSEARLSISIYSISGQRVRNLISTSFRAGEHIIRWDGTNETGSNVSSGMYIVGVYTGNRMVSHRMMLIK
ncbi:MAG: DUF362 domain-containing protein [Candidatus Latescibacter sp.]|nr:DUF362 domain-containing protein [Candidatus Latescibacter sp.]